MSTTLKMPSVNDLVFVSKGSPLARVTATDELGFDWEDDEGGGGWEPYVDRNRESTWRVWEPPIGEVVLAERAALREWGKAARAIVERIGNPGEEARPEPVRCMVFALDDKLLHERHENHRLLRVIEEEGRQRCGLERKIAALEGQIATDGWSLLPINYTELCRTDLGQADAIHCGRPAVAYYTDRRGGNTYHCREHSPRQLFEAVPPARPTGEDDLVFPYGWSRASAAEGSSCSCDACGGRPVVARSRLRGLCEGCFRREHPKKSDPRAKQEAAARSFWSSQMKRAAVALQSSPSGSIPVEMFCLQLASEIAPPTGGGAVFVPEWATTAPDQGAPAAPRTEEKK